MPLTLAATAVFMAPTISRDDRVLGARPLRSGDAERHRRILETVDRGGEEGVGGDVVDERELIGRVRSEGGLENGVGGHPLAGRGPAPGDWRWRAYR